MNPTELKTRVTSLKEKYSDTRKIQKAEKKKLSHLKDQLNNILRAQEIAQEAAEEIQQQVHKRIAHIVNKCLQAIFPDPYEFKIRFEPKRGKTEAELLFIRRGRERKNVGGGVIVITAFALRLSSLLLSRKSPRRTMALDQPFGDVSKDKGYLERVPEMMVMLAEEFGFQFIQVTHLELMKIGLIIEL